MLALPAQLGGLGISDPSKKCAIHYSMCETISAPLVRSILDQSEEYTQEVKAEQTRLRKNVRKCYRQNEVNTVIDLKENLPIRLQRAFTICPKKGASS